MSETNETTTDEANQGDLTSDAGVKSPKARGPISRFYIVNGRLARHEGGQHVEDCGDLGSVSDENFRKLAYEGYIRLRSQGETHDDIVSGKALPNRVSPAEGGNVKTAPKLWVQAVGQVFLDRAIKEARQAGKAKLTPDELEVMHAAAMEKAENVNMKVARKLTPVIAAYAKLAGDSNTTLDSLLESANSSSEAAPAEQAVAAD